MPTRRSQFDKRTASPIPSRNHCINHSLSANEYCNDAFSPHWAKRTLRNTHHPPSCSLLLAPKSASSSLLCSPQYNAPCSSNNHSTHNDRPLTDLRLVMFNARSLIGKLPSLRALVHSENPDIVLITETWLTKETTPEHISVAGYQSFGVNRLTRRGGGCLVYIKQPFCASTLQHPVLDKIPDSIWLSLPCGQLQLLIGCIYQPPNDCLNDVKHITDAFSHVSDLPFHVKIIGGDFNAPQICWSSLRAPRKLLSFVSCVRLGRWTQHVTSPTR